jgi:hypothetical protein
MPLYYIFLLIFLISIILAIRSMKDFNTPSEVNNIIREKKSKGTIVFFKKNIKHYSSSSSSDDSE